MELQAGRQPSKGRNMRDGLIWLARGDLWVVLLAALS